MKNIWLKLRHAKRRRADQLHLEHPILSRVADWLVSCIVNRPAMMWRPGEIPLLHTLAKHQSNSVDNIDCTDTVPNSVAANVDVSYREQRSVSLIYLFSFVFFCVFFLLLLSSVLVANAFEYMYSPNIVEPARTSRTEVAVDSEWNTGKQINGMSVSTINPVYLW